MSNLVVTPAPLAFTANDVNKTFGATLTGSVSSTSFTAIGLQNLETANTVTIAYGIGAAANAAIGTYNGSVIPSAATGGTFSASNYSVTYVPGNIIVNAIPVPIIATTGTLSVLTTTYGTPSSSTNFNVSGTNLTTGILVTPPPGFELSTDNVNFSNTVTITPGSGTIALTVVYIRFAAATSAGVYSGNILLSSTGAANINVPMINSTVIPEPLIITANNVTKTYGSAISGTTASTAYTITGGTLQNGNTINSLNVAYGAGSTAIATVNTYVGVVTPSAVIGANGFLNSNYAITYKPGDITVTAASLTIKASNVNKTYGTALVRGAGSTAFIATGLQNSETVTSVTTTYGAGATAISVVGTYAGSITVSAPIGNTFNAGNYIITYVPGDIVVNAANLIITANSVNKTYGTTINGAPGSTAFTVIGLQNAESVQNVTIAYGLGSAAIAQAGTYAGSVTASAATGGTFIPGNYTVTYNSGDIVISPALLTITANDKNRVFGEVNPILTVTYNGFVNNDSPAQLAVQPIVSTTATASSPIGQYPITASGAASPNYTFMYISGVLTIIQAAPAVSVYSAFTPNGDGINDTWNIKSIDSYPNCTVEIFDRNGTLLFFSNGYPAPWDGTYKGVKLPSGTYYYMINLKDGSKPISGWVAIIR